MKPQTMKTTLITTASSAIECYDFVIYAMLIPYLSLNFFPDQNPAIANLQNLAIFAIGCIPNYQSLGFLAPCLLIFCRMLQGISRGAEVPAAVTFITEHAPPAKRSQLCSFIFLGLGFGSLLASLLCFVLSKSISPVDMETWGWRVPFMFGGLLAICTYWIRKKTQETPMFQSISKSALKPVPILSILQKPQHIFQGLLLAIPPACFVTFSLTLMPFLKTQSSLNPSDIYLCISFGMLWIALIVPLLGGLGDHINPLKLLLIYAGIAILGTPLVFYLMAADTFMSICIAVLLFQSISGSFVSVYPTLLAGLFDTTTRQTGVSFCYNIAFMLGASFTWLLDKFALNLEHYLGFGMSFSVLMVMIFTFIKLQNHQQKTSSQLIWS